MGRSLIIQGIVSEFHFHVNNSNYSIKHITLGKWGGGQQTRCMDVNNRDFSIYLLGRSNPPSQAYLKGDIF